MPVATETIAKALRIVAAEGIQTEDGVIEACLRQAADRLERLEGTNAKLVEALEEYVALMTYQEPMLTQEWKAWRLKHFDRTIAALALARGEA